MTEVIVFLLCAARRTTKKAAANATAFLSGGYGNKIEKLSALTQRVEEGSGYGAGKDRQNHVRKCELQNLRRR